MKDFRYKNTLKCSTIYSRTLICQGMALPFGQDREVESDTGPAIPVSLATLIDTDRNSLTRSKPTNHSIGRMFKEKNLKFEISSV
jgi:hypothetical protein